MMRPRRVDREQHVCIIMGNHHKCRKTPSTSSRLVSSLRNNSPIERDGWLLPTNMTGAASDAVSELRAITAQLSRQKGAHGCLIDPRSSRLATWDLVGGIALVYRWGHGA